MVRRILVLALLVIASQGAIRNSARAQTNNFVPVSSQMMLIEQKLKEIDDFRQAYKAHLINPADTAEAFNKAKRAWDEAYNLELQADRNPRKTEDENRKLAEVRSRIYSAALGDIADSVRTESSVRSAGVTGPVRSIQLEDIAIALQTEAMSLNNPLRAGEGKKALSGVLQFKALMNGVQAVPSGWSVKLTGQPTSNDQRGGLFCYIASTDTVSIDKLKSVTPYTSISVMGSVKIFDLQPAAKIVLDPCKVL